MPGHVRSALPFPAHPRARFGAPSAPRRRAACPSARAVYETPEVQVYTRATKTRRVRDLLACTARDREGARGRRARQRRDGHRRVQRRQRRTRRALDLDEPAVSAAESADARDDRLTDLRTGVTFSVDVEDEFNRARARAARRRSRRRREGRRRALHRRAHERDARDGAEHRPGRQRRAGLLARERRRADGHAHACPRPIPRGRARSRRTIRRCKPRRGARLVLRTDALVLTRTGGASWVCRPTRGRNFRLGAVEGLRPVSDRHVAYTKPGLIGVFDAVRGSYRELKSTSAAASASALLAAGPGGLRAWAQTGPRRRSSPPNRRARWRWATASPTGSTRPAPPLGRLPS